MIASLGVVATQVRASLTIFELSRVTSKLVGKLASMQHCIQSFISKENTAKASVGVAALSGAHACKLWQ